MLAAVDGRTAAETITVHLLATGTHAWRTPYGRVLIVDHTGTTDLDTGTHSDTSD